jgi:uncharacterized protein (DUF58 family)
VQAELAVPLVPRRRVNAPVHGAFRSARRGRGGDLAGTRPYQDGDDVRRIDHRASVRLSSASGRNELVVREHFAENATRVLLVRDRRPSMALFPHWSPWLCKPQACGAAGRLLAASARRARCAFREEDDQLTHALEALAIGRLGRGSFVFVVSDFLVLPPEDVWGEAVERGWDVVPVVLQDPVWERSFPEAAGLVLPIWDPDGRRLRATLLTRRECAARRAANEERFRAISEQFDRLGLDPIPLAHHDDASVWRGFHEWSEARRVGVRGRL